MDPHPDDGVGVVPRAVGIDRDLGRLESGQPRAQRLGGRQIAGPDHELRLMSGREPRVAKQQVVMRDRGRPASRARQRVGEQRDPGRAASGPAPVPSPGSRSGPRRSRSAPAGASHRTVRSAGRPSNAMYGRPSARPVSSSGSSAPRSSTSGSRSGKLRCTGPAGPSAAVQEPDTRASGSTGGSPGWPR